MLEVVTDITTASGAGKVSVHYFDSGTVPDIAIAAVDSFWQAACAQLVNSTRFRVRANGREIDEATGTLTGFYQGTGFGERAGAVTGQQPVADATQALVRWRTGVVVAGREVRGRTFIPGLQVPRLVNGNLDGTAQGTFQAAILELIDVSIGFGVWRRPKEGTPGQHVVATAGDVWTELAVLRRRRG